MISRGLVLCTILTAAALALAASHVKADPVLSEVLCDNAKTLIDWRGERPDWIELHNPGKKSLELKGWYLSDDPDDLTKWRFPGGTIKPGRYFIVFASGLEGDELKGANLPHASFKLSADGEFIALIKPDGVTIAHSLDLTDTPQYADVSFGLPPDESGFRIDRDGKPSYLASPTPLQANDVTIGGVVAPVTASRPHGFFDAPLELELGSATPEVQIRYTTDGSEPTITSDLVPESVTISRTTTLRAVAFRSGWKASTTMTQTYIFLDDVVHQSSDGEAPGGWPQHRARNQVLDYGMDPDIVDEFSTPNEVKASLRSLPALSVVTSIENLFDPRRGIYANPRSKGRNWERPASLELIDPNANRRRFSGKRRIAHPGWLQPHAKQPQACPSSHLPQRVWRRKAQVSAFR